MLPLFLLLSLTVGALAQTKSSAHKITTKTHKATSASTPELPPMPTVDKPTAVIDTSAGRMTCTLYPDKSPKSVDNFVGLATGMKDWKDPKNGKPVHHVPLYNGTIFHRVIPNFMIQGGDPLGDGTGGPGYEIPDEFPDVKFDQPGRLAYANSGPNTDGSQFFITEAATPWLDSGHYTIFGTCDEATVTLVHDIARRARDERNDRPFDPVKIVKVTILGMPIASAPPTKATTHTTKKS
jgi:peptidyl-prolyl cis-trans isomerase A (cyclophilin A)